MRLHFVPTLLFKGGLGPWKLRTISRHQVDSWQQHNHGEDLPGDGNKQPLSKVHTRLWDNLPVYCLLKLWLTLHLDIYGLGIFGDFFFCTKVRCFFTWIFNGTHKSFVMLLFFHSKICYSSIMHVGNHLVLSQPLLWCCLKQLVGRKHIIRLIVHQS